MIVLEGRPGTGVALGRRRDAAAGPAFPGRPQRLSCSAWLSLPTELANRLPFRVSCPFDRTEPCRERHGPSLRRA
ncbi:hypothetical protein SGPA1_10237 [Streptomyces misionensis JCM 4497]